MLETVVDKFKTSLGALNQMCELAESLTGVSIIEMRILIQMILLSTILMILVMV